jgi:hypothetical protein
MRRCGSFKYDLGDGHYARRNLNIEGLCGFQVEHEFELVRQLNRQLARIGAFENAVDVICRAPEQLGDTP